MYPKIFSVTQNLTVHYPSRFYVDSALVSLVEFSLKLIIKELKGLCFFWVKRLMLFLSLILSVSALQFLFFTLPSTHYCRWTALLIGKKEKCKEEEEKTKEKKRECKKRGIIEKETNRGYRKRRKRKEKGGKKATRKRIKKIRIKIRINDDIEEKTIIEKRKKNMKIGKKRRKAKKKKKTKTRKR